MGHCLGQGGGAGPCSSTCRIITRALSPDDRFVALGGLDDRRPNRQLDPAIRIWELTSGQEVAKLQGHEARTRYLAFSPDGRWLASGCLGNNIKKEETIRIWDMATGRELRRFEGHLGPITTVAFAFTADGRSLVCTRGDATALVWDLTDLAEAVAADRPIADEVLKAWWDELAGADARAAYRAAGSLAFLRPSRSCGNICSQERWVARTMYPLQMGRSDHPKSCGACALSRHLSESGRPRRERSSSDCRWETRTLW